MQVLREEAHLRKGFDEFGKHAAGISKQQAQEEPDCKKSSHK
jgi:hypothetical protein